MKKDEIVATLKAIGAAPLKELGQHFLICQEVLDCTIKRAEVSKKDAVIEIGPGLGVLTSRLLEHAGRVIAIEKDRKYASYLAGKFQDFLADGKLAIIHQDILRANLPQIINQHLPTKEPRYKVIANLPYNIASQVILLFLKNATPPENITALIQKEVAERISAKPPFMNLLALKIQRLSQPSIVKSIGPDCFYPAPAVDSSLLHLAHIKSLSLAENAKYQFLVKIGKAGFSSPRKTLSNNLMRLGVPKRETEVVLRRLNKSPLARPQELSLGDWESLAVSLTDDLLYNRDSLQNSKINEKNKKSLQKESLQKND